MAHTPNSHASVRLTLVAPCQCLVRAWSSSKELFFRSISDMVVVSVCGVPFLVCLAILALVVSFGALLLLVRFKQEKLMSAYMPFCFLPLMAGLIQSLLAIGSGIGMQMDDSMDFVVDSGLLLQMNLLPLLVGAVACAPALLITTIGRWRLVWKASGLRLLRERASEGATKDGDGDQSGAWVEQETNDYLERLVRPR